VVGGELDVKPEPGVRALVTGRESGVGTQIGSAGGMVLVGNFGKGLGCIADGPGRVVKVGAGRGRIGGNADAPSLVEGKRGTEVSGIETGLRKTLESGWSGASMGVLTQKPLDGGMRRRLLGHELRGSANGYGCYPQDDSAHVISPLVRCSPL
jgi:hypothetical protein